jgi:hypothetical protein
MILFKSASLVYIGTRFFIMKIARRSVPIAEAKIFFWGCAKEGASRVAARKPQANEGERISHTMQNEQNHFSIARSAVRSYNRSADAC